jgi:hypothetical protein
VSDGPIWTRILTDGGQEPLDIAGEVAAFVDAARHTLDLCRTRAR